MAAQPNILWIVTTHPSSPIRQAQGYAEIEASTVIGSEE